MKPVNLAFWSRIACALLLVAALSLPHAGPLPVGSFHALADDNDSGDNDGGDNDGGGDDGGGDDGGGDDGDDGDDGGDDGDDDDGDDDDGGGEEPGLGDDDVTGGSGRDFENNEIVAYGVPSRSRRVLQGLGFTPVDAAPLASFAGTIERYRIPAWLDETDALRIASERVPDARFDLNTLYRLRNSEPCDGRCAAEAHLRWDEAASNCTAETRIGMIDTRVDRGHRFLASAAMTLRTFRGSGRKPSPSGHGTAVASLLVGADSGASVGLLPQATLYAADAFHFRRGGSRADTLDLVRALDWLVAQQVDVINMSFSGAANGLFEFAITKTAERGISLVGAAGDHGEEPGLGYPAAYPQVVAVTAVDNRLRPYRAAARGPQVAFAAPGVNLLLAAPGGGTKPRTGTSFAAPFVSAALALLRSEGAVPAEAGTELLKRSARDLGPPGRDPVFGWGLLRLPASLTCRG